MTGGAASFPHCHAGGEGWHLSCSIYACEPFIFGEDTTILASALRYRADLVVMGTHGRRGLSDGRFGSVADAVLRLATCPILSVKTPKVAPGQRPITLQLMGVTEIIKGVEP